MNEWEKLHEAANRYKKMYPEGTRIELLSMSVQSFVEMSVFRGVSHMHSPTRTSDQ